MLSEENTNSEEETTNGMCQITLYFVFFIFALSVKNVKTVTSSAIPALLQHCYINKTNLTYQHPRTLQEFLEIIRKLETDPRSFVNARILSTSMLHGVIFDGVRKSEGFDNLAIPFRATGDEFYKYRLLVDYFTSGESLLFPSEALTSSELCFLHTLISNTVDLRRRGDESTTCTHHTNLPFEVDSMEDQSKISRCPIKKGVINTHWGSVSAGHLIKAIASALQKTKVTVETINKNKNFTSNKNQVDNVWISTVAGDLGAVVLKQTSETPEIGTGGFWNDTLLPRIYYLENGNWDMTESDILGGIDGLAIARYLEDNDVRNMRVSQLIDMFYSERGIMNNAEYKAANRSLILRKLLQENRLENQIADAARLLQNIGIYDAFLYPEQIDSLAAATSVKFRAVAENITKIYDNVESIHGIQMKSSMEVIMILDGSYDAYTALQIIKGVSEAIQVSRYDSRLGVINGQSGNWMANVTRELFQLFNDLEQSTSNWPSTLSLKRSLESVIHYYKYIETNCSNTKPIGRSIVIVTKDAQITDDLESSVRVFDAIKKSNPETSFVVISVSTTETGLMEFTRNFWNNDYVLTSSGSTNAIIQDITTVLSQIPGHIANYFCQRGQMEDYVTPNRETRYQIRKEYTEGSVVTTFCKSNQGKLSVCASAAKSTEICRNLTVNDEISFDSSELCTPAIACNVEFRIFANTSEDLCVDVDCRYPDQVRLSIIWERSSGYVPEIVHVYLIFSSVFLSL